MANLNDIAHSVRPTISIGDKSTVWFIREKLVGWFEESVEYWLEWCKEDGIEPIEEVLKENMKLLNAIKTCSTITKKTVDWKLVMGYDVDIDKLALDWLDLYLDYEVKK
ncbi:hypothetical protein [Aeromonas phage AS-zj]|uniref:Uncharacterized protein n=4 Tax=Caudoviricetes TaxID=2731619 RepID=A0A411B8J6_9CAUD|nr:hypothetical protein HWB28_gp055 [Aeromonas phage AS-zj]YP_009834986.1 hypothetical protein HWB29_gp284 [Aeromonas phage AS-sw]QAX97939.1 hypothetical protein ASswx1_297 [Aeromonas phage Asswx_1]QMV28874.1 hypothetical protein AP1_0167 [Aeromonas phage AP1]UKM62568.1 hypothetical protein P19_0080 [Aeromonas phage P19]ASU00497.1 hypothetical protein [Aeromonas phage AS-zj]ATI18334.1 hypothetical protein [Aeromonas phage AS-sw]